jgi:hypothetical protein
VGPLVLLSVLLLNQEAKLNILFAGSAAGDTCCSIAGED